MVKGLRWFGNNIALHAQLSGSGASSTSSSLLLTDAYVLDDIPETVLTSSTVYTMFNECWVDDGWVDAWMMDRLDG